jgi:hypothetical protein
VVVAVVGVGRVVVSPTAGLSLTSKGIGRVVMVFVFAQVGRQNLGFGMRTRALMLVATAALIFGACGKGGSGIISVKCQRNTHVDATNVGTNKSDTVYNRRVD